MKNIFIIDDVVVNPAVGVFEKCEASDISVESVKLSDFLKSFGCIFDTSTGHLSMPEPDRSPQAGNHVRYVDCVVEISTETLENFGDDNRLLSRGQVSYCYQLLLNALREKPREDTCYSTVGKLLPLFTQWTLIQKHFSNISVPEYKYGYGPEEISDDEFVQPIHKSPFDFYQWRPSKVSEPAAFDRFVVDRPIGAPVLSYFLDDVVAVSPLAEGAEALVEERSTVLQEHTQALKSLFGAVMGECLWFVDGASITFAAFSHHLAAAARQPQFKRLASAYLAGAGT